MFISESETRNQTKERIMTFATLVIVLKAVKVSLWGLGLLAVVKYAEERK